MSVFLSDNNTANLYVQFFYTKNNPKSKNELIYVRDVEAVKKIRSRALSGLESRGECTPARFLNNT